MSIQKHGGKTLGGGAGGGVGVGSNPLSIKKVNMCRNVLSTDFQIKYQQKD